MPANQQSPAVAGPTLPPVTGVPFTNQDGFLTKAALNVLQQIWAGVFGTGGISEKIPLAANPSATAGPVVIVGTAATFMRSDSAPKVQVAAIGKLGLVQPDGASIQISGAGVLSATAAAANPTATAGPSAINGSASTYMRSDASPAVQKATISQLGLVQADGVTIDISAAGVISAGKGYVVAMLPAAGVQGRRAWVTDATSPTFLGTLTGGGAVVCPVFDNGAAWVAG
jgi:hypothetical protein